MRLHLSLTALVVLGACSAPHVGQDAARPIISGYPAEVEVTPLPPADRYEEFRTPGRAPIITGEYRGEQPSVGSDPDDTLDLAADVAPLSSSQMPKISPVPQIDPKASRLERLRQNPVVAAMPEEDVVDNVFKPATGATESYAGKPAKTLLGKTVVSLGPTEKPGLWVSAPFIKADSTIEVTAPETGLTVEVQATRNEALAQMSLAAFQALQLSPTRLVELEFRSN